MMMTPDEKSHLMDRIEEVVDKAVKKTVNGRLEELHEKFDAHKIELEPIVEAYSTAKNSGKAVISLAKLFGAIGVIGATIAAFIKFFK